jgi:uncharacterized protein YbjT (DUF2867 family)
MNTIAIVGATGNIGSRIAGALADAGRNVRAIARNPKIADGRLERHAADLKDPGSAIAEAAAKQGVEHVVMHTAVRANWGNTGAGILDNLAPVEQQLAQSGVGYTILRPAWFLQNLWAARDYLQQGVVSLPWPADMSWAATDINDIATAALRFLDEGPADRGYDVHVPGGITGQQIADAATRVLGHDVAYQQADATTRQYVDGFPTSEPHKDLYAELFDYFTSTTYAGEPEDITDDLDGFEIHGVEHFLRSELFATQ